MEEVKSTNSQSSLIKYLTLDIQKPSNIQLNLHITAQPAKTGLEQLNGTIEKILNKRISRYTLPIFLERARLIHGDRYNYDKIKEINIRNKHSEIVVICNICKYEWITTIEYHVIKKHNCPSCTNHVKWTYDRFMCKAREIHGNKFNYDKITTKDIVGNLSHVPVICNICDYEWNPTIHNHINSCSDCPSCMGHAPWTYDRLIKKSHEIHENRFDYSKIKPEHINSVYSVILIICTICDYEWEPTIHNHINGKSGCPSCSDLIPWTLERFISKGRKIHGNKFCYDKITPNDIKGASSKVPVSCNDCGYEWLPRIGNHINGRYSCPSCSNKEPWTLDRFIKSARNLHGDKYNYNFVTADMIINVKSRIMIICNRCQLKWNPTIQDHINGKTECPHCSMSRGYSNAQIKWIEDIIRQENITIQYSLSPGGEHSILGVGKVDGFYLQTNTVYEYHGDFWHGNPNKFNQNDINPVSKKSYGELYTKTLQRDRTIRDLGYNLIVKWETDPPV